MFRCQCHKGRCKMIRQFDPDALCAMSDYAAPQFSIQEVNSAGKALVSLDTEDKAFFNAVDVIDNWRASHSYPLQAFYVTLKRRACSVHKSALTAQRLKRLESIALKLIRENEMKLSQMQDIGGCRAILPTIAHVRKLEQIYKNSKWDHKWLKPKDYIVNPKPSGYRGIHLKYRFSGKGKKSAYDGLKIEIQIRTKLQHIWATAVEASDTFTKQALKSSHGREEWKRFFALMGSVFALREKEQTVPGTPITLPELASELKQLDASHHIVSTFAGYRAILPHVENKSDATYFLVTLDSGRQEVRIKGFKRNESRQANIEYTEAERNSKENPKMNVVLVSVASINALKRAYPNYFLDTDDFIKEVQKIVLSMADPH